MSKRQEVLSSENMGALLSALPDPAFVLTRNGRYAAVFGGSDPRYYHDGSGLVGLSIRDVLNEDKASWFIAVIARALDTNTLHIVEYELAGRDVKGLSEDGPAEPIWFEGRVHRLDFQVAGEDAVLWVASNITTRHELETKLRSASETDALTNLRNRRHFEQRAGAELERSSRYGEPVLRRDNPSRTMAGSCAAPSRSHRSCSPSSAAPTVRRALHPTMPTLPPTRRMTSRRTRRWTPRPQTPVRT